GSGPSDLTVVNGVLYFSADDPLAGRELYRSGGTNATTYRVKDINPGASRSLLADSASFASLHGVVYFQADHGVNGAELWRSEGTAAGTRMVKDIAPGSAGGGAAGITVVNGVLFFSADDGMHGSELWRSDGTAAGTTMVKDINPGASRSDPEGLTA